VKIKNYFNKLEKRYEIIKFVLKKTKGKVFRGEIKTKKEQVCRQHLKEKEQDF